MTREESKSCIGTIELLRRLAYNIHGVMDVIDADNCEKIIKALEQEPCGDAISKQAIQTELKNCEVVNVRDENDNFVGYYNADTVDSIIRNLPPVIPQPKMGRWIYTGDYVTDGMLKCSECGFEHDVSERFSFCPNCGSKNG